MKVCNKCGVEKDDNLFYKHKCCKGGIVPTCKECAHQNQRKWRAVNKEKLSLYQKEHREKYREKRLLTIAKYQTKNKEKILLYQKEYKKKNADIIAKKSKEYHKTKECKASAETYYQKHKNKISNRFKEQIENLEDSYVTRMLLKERNVPSDILVTPELIKLKRLSLIIKRSLKTHNV